MAEQLAHAYVQKQRLEWQPLDRSEEPWASEARGSRLAH